MDLLSKIILFVKVSFFMFLYFYPVGFSIQKLLCNNSSTVFEGLGLRLGLGFGVFVPFGIAGYLLKFSMGSLNILWVSILAICLAYLVVSIWKQRERLINRLELGDLFSWLLLFCLLVVFINVQTLAEGNYSSDFWYHIAQSRSYVDSNQIHNNYPYFKEAIRNSLYPYNNYHLIYALISWATHEDPLFVWEVMRLIIIFIFTTNISLFLKELTNSKERALIALCIVWICFLYIPGRGGFGGLTVWQFANYPKIASIYCYIPLIGVTVIRYIKSLEKKWIFSGSLLCAAMESWHIQNIQYILLLLSGLSLGFLLFRQTEKAGKTFLFLLFSMIGPLLILAISYCVAQKSAGDYSVGHDFGTFGWMFLKISDGWYILKPSHFFTFGSNKILPWSVLALIVIPFCVIFLKREKIIVAYILGVTLLPLLIVFNPIALAIIWKIAPPFTAERYFWILPVTEAAGLSFSTMIFRSNLANKKNSFKIAVCICLAIILLTPYIGPKSSKYVLKNKNHRVSKKFLAACESFAKLADLNSLVFSDLKTSYVLPAIKEVHILTAKKRIVRWATDNYEDTEQNVADFFKKETSSKRRGEIARNYSSDIVVVNKRIYGFFNEKSVEGYKTEYSSDLFIIMKRV